MAATSACTKVPSWYQVGKEFGAEAARRYSSPAAHFTAAATCQPWFVRAEMRPTQGGRELHVVTTSGGRASAQDFADLIGIGVPVNVTERQRR